VKTVLLFAIPPLAGALIGFVTNVVAIRMLFRPLREIRVFGVRLPFTPGILPRQRRRLAESIGAMVERELLTPDLLRQRLNDAGFREQARRSVSRCTEQLLTAPPQDLAGGHADQAAALLRAGMERLYPAAAASLIAFLRQDDIRRELEARGRVFFGDIMLKLNVFQRLVFSAGQYDLTVSRRMPEIIDDCIGRIAELLNDDSVRQMLQGAAGDALDRLFASADTGLGDLLAISGGQKEALDDLLCSWLLRAAEARLETVLASLDVRDMVARRVDSLEMIRVERIILDVMASQLKWINVFGAVLGFLIGLFQALFTLLTR
jgi:uncharacterized membrane protein YheB (UPF0754 family)